MSLSDALAHAVCILITTLKLDPGFVMSKPSLGPWRELEEALAQYEAEQREKHGL